MGRGITSLFENQFYKLTVDWSYLYGGNGRKQIWESFDKNLGRLCFLISISLVLVSSVLLLLEGKFPLVAVFRDNSLVTLIFWIGALALCFAIYLNRDHSEYSDRLINDDIYSLINNLQRGKSGLSLEFTRVAEQRLLLMWDISAVNKSGNQVISLLEQSLNQSRLAASILFRLGLTQQDIETNLLPSLKGIQLEQIESDLISYTVMLAIELQSKQIGPIHIVLFAIERLWTQQLLDLNITNDDINGLKLWLANDQRKQRYIKLWSERAIYKPRGNVNRAYTSVYTDTLNQYSEDYTYQAANGLFELMVGRDELLKQLVISLRNPRNNALMLVAKSGVGKTRLLRHLAVRMVVEDVPPELVDKRLVVFDFNRAYSELQSLDAFKSVVQRVMDEVAITKDIVLVLEDFGQLLNIRADAATEVMNLIVSATSKYGIRMITTINEDAYLKFVRPNPNVASLFSTIELSEPNTQVALQIVMDELPALESRYGVTVQFQALKLLVQLSVKVGGDRAMPSRAIVSLADLLIAAQSQGTQEINTDFVSTFYSTRLGVNVGNIVADESQKLLSLEDEMHKRVIGQDAAVTAIASALRRSRAGLSKHNKPVVSLLFYGPTGVGKTEVAKTLAETYYGNEQAMIRLDMSEYQEESNLERLIGVQDNGQLSGGYLTEPIRRNPFSLLLLDELEKAYPKVLDLFLQVLDDGYLTDGMGRKVDFTNAIIIATSNAASSQIATALSEGKGYEMVMQETTPLLRQVYKVEFLNRFDQLIMFKSLTQVEVGQIVIKFLQKLGKNLTEKGISLEYTDKLVSEIAQIAYNPVYGAREVGRVIQDRVETKIADLIITGQLRSGKKVRFESLADITTLD